MTETKSLLPIKNNGRCNGINNDDSDNPGVRGRKKVVVSLTLHVDVINLFRRKDERRVQKVYQTRKKNVDCELV